MLAKRLLLVIFQNILQTWWVFFSLQENKNQRLCQRKSTQYAVAARDDDDDDDCDDNDFFSFHSVTCATYIFIRVFFPDVFSLIVHCCCPIGKSHKMCEFHVFTHNGGYSIRRSCFFSFQMPLQLLFFFYFAYLLSLTRARSLPHSSKSFFPPCPLCVLLLLQHVFFKIYAYALLYILFSIANDLHTHTYFDFFCICAGCFSFQ